MNILETQIIAWLTAWFWPFIRIGAIFMVAPFFSARGIPIQIRVLLAAFFTLMVAPVLPAPPAVDPLSWAGITIALHQMLIGLGMGFILQMVFAALTMAGEGVAMGMGLGFAVMMDPQNGFQVPVVAQYYVIMATLLFLALGGHLAFLALLMESFHILPVGVAYPDAGIWLLIQWAGEMYAGAVLLALPVMIAILVVNIAFGVVARSAPQLNIFAVGFPVTLLIGLLLMLFNWPGQAGIIETMLQEAMQAVGEFLGG